MDAGRGVRILRKGRSVVSRRARAVASRISEITEGTVKSSSAWAMRVETGGLLVKIGAASRIKLWIGLEEKGVMAGAGAVVGAVSAAGALVTTLDVAISGFVEAMLGGWGRKEEGMVT